MFQCPNCRAYTDLSAEVDVEDSNDSNDVDTSKQNDDIQEQPQTSAEAQSESQEPSAESGSAAAPTQEQEQDHTESNRQTNDAPVEEGLADNIENMRLQDDSLSEAEAEAERTPNMSSGSPEPAVSNVTSAPTTGSDASFLPSQPVAIRRTDTPFRSESSDDNPLTPRNDSGPLAFDGRAGMP
jgi:hypothetical protein